jgi:EmrB/QacA subfamily drug resistance transporter
MPLKLTDENRKWWTLGAVTASLFMVMLDTTIVNVALPSIQSDLEAALSKLEWIVNAFLLVYASLLLTGGKLADFFGRRRLFLMGLAVFTLASLGCALAPSENALIAGRAVQGVGAALMLPATHSLIAANFAPRQRGMAYGIWAAVSTLGLSLGPLVGGLLVDGLDWRWIFYVNVPFGIVALIAASLIIRESKDTSVDQRLDFPGLLTGATALFAVVFALIESNRYGWGSVTILGSFGLAALAFAIFVAVEARQRNAMLDLSLFRNSTFAGANLASLLIMLAMLGFLFFVSLYLQTVIGYSATRAGAALLPMTIMLMFMAPVAGKLSDRGAARWLIAVGMTILAAALAYLSRLDADSTFVDMLPGFIAGGIGVGLSMAPATTTAIGSVPVDKSGVASGVLNTFRQGGGALGVATLGAILTSNLHGAVPGSPAFAAGFVPGFQDALLVAAGCALAGGVIAVVMIRRVEHEEIPERAPTVVDSPQAPLLSVNGPEADVVLQPEGEPEAYPCPVCMGQGWFPFEPPQDPRTATCARCHGHGKVLTGSHVAGHTVRDCPECQGQGYVEVRAPYEPMSVTRGAPTESPAS